jgi:hypothetical protein
MATILRFHVTAPEATPGVLAARTGQCRNDLAVQKISLAGARRS